jgi:single-stranded-DNA-specific exonuclease
MEKQWKVARPDPETLQAMNDIKGMHPVIARILASRSLGSYAAAEAFFNPSLDALHDPFLMKDMDRATERIIRAMTNREKILVYGDYDVDGTTSVACMYAFLCELYDSTRIDYYIPHRYREGYGISQQGIDYADAEGYTLVIALDCGIKSVELIAEARARGIDFIVCDHHLPGESLPPAVAILNPKQADCPYPYKELCGCGVGFKLISALAQKNNIEKESTYRFLDLVATAIAADIVPMTGENRILAFHGVKRVNEQPSTGIRALIDVSGHQKALTITNVVFMIAPRVNAAGRMDDARKAVQLFIERDYDKAHKLAMQLQVDNTERREEDARITEEALEMLRTDDILQDRKSTVVYRPEWHKGVIGIVASRLIDHYYRPTVVLTRSNGIVAGSARSIPGFNLHDGLDACADLLLGFGGHYFAAGMTLDEGRVEAFRERFDKIVRERLTEDMFRPVIHIDTEIRFRDLGEKFYLQLNRLEPFGPENLQPVFLARALQDDGQSRIVKDKHLRFSLRQDGKTMTGIGFGLAGKMPLLQQGPVDLVFCLEENEWKGQKNMQLKVIDLRPA